MVGETPLTPTCNPCTLVERVECSHRPKGPRTLFDEGAELHIGSIVVRCRGTLGRARQATVAKPVPTRSMLSLHRGGSNHNRKYHRTLTFPASSPTYRRKDATMRRQKPKQPVDAEWIPSPSDCWPASVGCASPSCERDEVPVKGCRHTAATACQGELAIEVEIQHSTANLVLMHARTRVRCSCMHGSRLP